MLRSPPRGKTRRMRREAVRQLHCLLTGLSLLLQQVSPGDAYCTGLAITGPCAGNPDGCCGTRFAPIVGSSGGGGCGTGSCGGEEHSFEVALTADPVHLLRGAVVEQATDLAVSGPNFTWAQRRSYDSINPRTYDLGYWKSNSRGMYLYDMTAKACSPKSPRPTGRTSTSCSAMPTIA